MEDNFVHCRGSPKTVMEEEKKEEQEDEEGDGEKGQEEKDKEEKDKEKKEEKKKKKKSKNNIIINLTATAIVFFKPNSTIYYHTCNFSHIFFLGFSTSSGVPDSQPSTSTRSPGELPVAGMSGSTARGSSLQCDRETSLRDSNNLVCTKE